MKILIAIPTFDDIKPEVFKAIYDLDSGGNTLVFDYIRGYDAPSARNRIVKKAIEIDADYVLMVDSDTIIPKDAIVNFLEDPKDICLGHYPRRIRSVNGLYDVLKTCIYRIGEFDYTRDISCDEMKSVRESGIYKMQIHGGGFGCAMIKTSLFSEFTYPWFSYVNYADDTSLSEDLYFCSLCASKNIPVYVDTRVVCSHIFDCVYSSC